MMAEPSFGSGSRSSIWLKSNSQKFLLSLPPGYVAEGVKQLKIDVKGKFTKHKGLKKTNFNLKMPESMFSRR